MKPKDAERARALAVLLERMDSDVARTRGRLMYQVGRRGVALLFFALLDSVYCYSLLFPDAAARRSGSLYYLSGIAPLWFWGVLWGVAGLICAIHAFRINDRFGFAAAICIKMLWGGLMMSASIIGDVERAYVSGTIWLCVAGWLGVISTWPEPPIPAKHGREPHHISPEG